MPQTTSRLGREMADLRIGETNVTELLREELGSGEGNFVAILQVPEESYLQVNLETIRVLVKKFNYSGLYITIQRPHTNLMKLFKKQGISAERISFIDAASSAAEETGRESRNCIYVPKELGINNLTRATYKMLPNIKEEKKFLFLDSITTLMLYQPLSETLRFAEFLTRTLRKTDLSAIIMNVGSEFSKEKFIKDIVFQCDKIIEIR